MAIDSATKRASALQVGLPPGVVLPVPDGAIDAGDRAHLVGLYDGIAAGAPSTFTAAGYVGGVAVDASGVLGTAFLAAATPVPASAVFINGFAHTQAGLRYVCAWPVSGIVDYANGIARRPDGAMCIVGAGVPRDYAGGWGLSGRGEVIVSTNAPQLVLGGFGLRQDGSLCVSEAA